MKQKVLDTFRKKTSDLAWAHMMNGNYDQAFKVMEVGRNVLNLVQRVQTYKPLYK